MNQPDIHIERRDRIIARLLWFGTWLASAVIAAGLILNVLQRSGILLGFSPGGYSIVRTGVALFILLPVARVALMLVIFLRERDYTYVLISALVLAIIVAGVVIGIRS